MSKDRQIPEGCWYPAQVGASRPGKQIDIENIATAVAKDLYMTHTHAKLFYHLIWSTKERQPIILPGFRDRLYQYMGGIVKNSGTDLLKINGTNDHVHLLVYTKPEIMLSHLVRQIKARSTKWLNTTIPEVTNFRWQDGYGVFSVSYSQVASVEKYIVDQEHRHQHTSYENEYIAFLRKHDIDYDNRFVLG